MTDAQIAEWSRLTEAATPGPWEADLSPGSDPDEGIPNHGWVWPPKVYSDGDGDYMLWEDVQFCAAARTAMPVLLAEVKRLRAATPGGRPTRTYCGVTWTETRRKHETD